MAVSGDNKYHLKLWNIVKEQLVSLCLLQKLQKGNEDFQKLVNDLENENVCSNNLIAIIYYVLGLIDYEEREKLIQWPLINIRTNAKFRKGVTAMVDNFQEKYPWAHLEKIPESYLMNPTINKLKFLEFLSNLTDLATHIVLNEPETLVMQSVDGLNPDEIRLMSEIIVKAKEDKEEKIKNNLLPLGDIEDAINEQVEKCISLKALNVDLQQQLENLKKEVISKNIFPKGKNIILDDLKEITKQKATELDKVNEELSEYFNQSKEVLEKMKALKNPKSISSKDFGFENSNLDIQSSTTRVIEELCQLLKNITIRTPSKEELMCFYEKLLVGKQTVAKENEALKSFLGNQKLRLT